MKLRLYNVMWRARLYREFGPRCKRNSKYPLVHEFATTRFATGIDRYRPVLAWESRQKGGALWARGTQ